MSDEELVEVPHPSNPHCCQLTARPVAYSWSPPTDRQLFDVVNADGGGSIDAAEFYDFFFQVRTGSGNLAHTLLSLVLERFLARLLQLDASNTKSARPALTGNAEQEAVLHFAL